MLFAFAYVRIRENKQFRSILTFTSSQFKCSSSNQFTTVIQCILPLHAIIFPLVPLFIFLLNFPSASLPLYQSLLKTLSWASLNSLPVTLCYSILLSIPPECCHAFYGILMLSVYLPVWMCEESLCSSIWSSLVVEVQYANATCRL